MKADKKTILFFLLALLFLSPAYGQDTIIFKRRSELYLGNFVQENFLPSLYCDKDQLYVFCAASRPRLFRLNDKMQLNEIGLPPEMKKIRINDLHIINEKEFVFITYDDIFFLKGKELRSVYLKRGDDGNRRFAFLGDQIIFKELMNTDFDKEINIPSDSIVKLKLYSLSDKKTEKTILLPFYHKELSYFNHDNYFTRSANYVLLTSMGKPEYYLADKALNVTSYFEEEMREAPSIGKKILNEKFEAFKLNHDPIETFNPIFKDYFVNGKFTATMGAVFFNDSSFITTFKYRDQKDTTIQYEKFFFYKIRSANSFAKIIKTGTCTFQTGMKTTDDPQFFLIKTIVGSDKKLYQLKTHFEEGSGSSKYFLYEYDIR